MAAKERDALLVALYRLEGMQGLDGRVRQVEQDVSAIKALGVQGHNWVLYIWTAINTFATISLGVLGIIFRYHP